MSYRFRTLVAPLALALLSGVAAHPAGAQQTTPAAPAQTARITITGEVVDAQSGVPLDDVVISLPGINRKTVTDERGRFEIRDLYPGTYRWVVSRLGYATWEEEVESRENGAAFTVRLLARPEVLEGITVVVDRFQVRRGAEAASVRVVERDEILSSAGPTAFELLSRAAIRPIVCQAGNPDYNCATVRGRVMRPAVYIDDMYAPAGMETLRTMVPQEIYLIESFSGGRGIRVYTTWYVEQIARGRRALPPIRWW